MDLKNFGITHVLPVFELHSADVTVGGRDRNSPPAAKAEKSWHQRHQLI